MWVSSAMDNHSQRKGRQIFPPDHLNVAPENADANVGQLGLNVTLH